MTKRPTKTAPAPKKAANVQRGKTARRVGGSTEKAVNAYIKAWTMRGGLRLWLVSPHSTPIGKGLGRYSGATPMVDLVGRFFSTPVALDIKSTTQAKWTPDERTLPAKEQLCLSEFAGEGHAFAGLLVCVNADTKPSWSLWRAKNTPLGLQFPAAHRYPVADILRLQDTFSFALFGTRVEEINPPKPTQSEDVRHANASA